MNVVIIGCGRVGARLASTLDQGGHRVAIVDLKPDAFRRLPREFGGSTVIGTGIDEDVLKSAGIQQADAFVAVTNGDNTNIMAAQIAHSVFNVAHVTARIYDPVREETYRKLGIHTICPTTTIASLIVGALFAS
jgi:trk system potassium uptake protein